jgi:type I restriction enzyme S subunit
MITESKKGYKKTKLGWIPEDWKNCKFSDIPDQKIKWSLTGGPFGSDLKSSDYTDESGVRIIQLQNIGDGSFLNSYKIFTSEEKADQLIGCNIYPGELILSKMGDPVTRTCIIPDFHDRYLMASDGIRLVPDKTKFDKKFVLEFINFELFRNIAIAHSTGSTRQRIGLGDLKKLPFVCPPLPEQQKIAAILSTWDKAIAKLTQLIAAKEQRKKGLMQVLLTGKKRFAGFTDEWKEVKLGEVTKSFAGGTPTSTNSDYYSGSIPFIGSGELNQETVTRTNKYLSEEGLNNSSAKLVNPGTLLVAMYGATAGVCAITEITGAINQAVLALIPSKKIETRFLFYKLLLQMPHVVFRMVQGGQPNLSGSIIKSVKINVPEVEEQLKIASVLSAADKEIELLKNELERLQQQKKGLMQVLLTGEKRVDIKS